MSLFADYKWESEKKLTLENEHGFATYEIKPPYVYIEDIYVCPEFRSKGIMRDMVATICDIAKEAGCTKLLGTCCPARGGSTEAMRIWIKYGFRLTHISGSLVWMEKEI